MVAQHVIIGGGPVATNAIESIRQFDKGASAITVVSDEPAHSRMALPYWLAGQKSREHTYTADAAYYEKLGVEAKIGVRVASVRPRDNRITLADGSDLAYDNLLIGTGASPLDLPVPGGELAGVQNLWNLSQTESLLNAAEGKDRPRVLMIGAGFIGFIMLNAMYKRGWDLTVVERESQVLPRMLDNDGAALVRNWLEAKGVAVHCGKTVQSIEQSGDAKTVTLDDGSAIDADVVIVAIGIKPNVSFLDDSGIEVDQGILVNDQLQTNFANVFAGGDVAQGPVLYRDKNEIHPIHPTAVDHGRVAGANMAGESIQYGGSLLMNILDACGLQTASFGNWDDAEAEVSTINNVDGFVYRKLLWRDDRLVGAMFAGRANDMGMLTDVGMVKGILQTETALGAWKSYLTANPFDIRRAYIGAGVAQKLTQTTLLGRPSKTRQFQFGGEKPVIAPNAAHAVFVGTKED